MTRYDELIARRKSKYGSKFDPSELAPQFIPYFNSGERIEVDYGYEKQRGRIGVTTGWKPIFLLMRRVSDHGSSYTLSKKDKIVRVISR